MNRGKRKFQGRQAFGSRKLLYLRDQLLIAFRQPCTLESVKLVHRSPNDVNAMIEVLIQNNELVCVPNSNGRLYQASGQRFNVLLEPTNASRALYKDEERLLAAILKFGSTRRVAEAFRLPYKTVQNYATWFNIDVKEVWRERQRTERLKSDTII